jgi:hypothetical protein
MQKEVFPVAPLPDCWFRARGSILQPRHQLLPKVESNPSRQIARNRIGGEKRFAADVRKKMRT